MIGYLKSAANHNTLATEERHEGYQPQHPEACFGGFLNRMPADSDLYVFYSTTGVKVK